MRALILLVLCSTACESSSTGIDDDRDRDGFRVEFDCNDGDASVHPEAEEICDGKDNNCNGEVDEGVTITFFADDDLDGWGDPLTVALACEAGSGAVTNGGDCNDGSAAVNPDTPEICDEVDNDCDGEIDEGVTTSFYVDRDGDGYGDPMLSVQACEAVAWATESDGDCNDSDPGVHPGMVENCDNSIDDDCDGIADADCPVEHCGAIGSDETWAAGPAHLVTCDVHVRGAASPVLTIGEGARVVFDPGTRLTVGDGAPGRLDVVGGATGVIFRSSAALPQPGDWKGLEFRSRDDGSLLQGLLLRHAGGDGSLGAVDVRQADIAVRGSIIQESESHGLYIGTSATAEVSGSQLRDNAKSGLFVAPFAALSAIGAPSFVGNTLTGNAEFPALVRIADVTQLDSSSSFAGNGIDQVRVVGGALAADGVWQALDVPLYIDDESSVGGSADPLLVWEDGLTVQMALGKGLVVGLSVPGRLVVEGDGGSGVVLESERGNSGAPGDWQGLKFEFGASGSVLDGLTVRHAGGNGLGGVAVSGSVLEVHACTIEDNLEHGIYVVSSGELALSDSNISNNEEDGVHLALNGKLATTAGPTCVNNTISGNGGVPLSTEAESVGQIDGSNSLSGNGQDRVEIRGGAVESFATWHLLDVPFWLTSDVTINGPAAPVVTLEPGTMLLFDAGTGLEVARTGAGGLVAEGTPTNRITFTSALAAPSAGDWEGLRFSGPCVDANVRLANVDVAYGGANGFGNVFFSGCDGSVTDSELRNSSAWGLYRLSAAPTLSNLSYADNSSGDLF